MRILVCGDRKWADEKTMEEFFKTLPKNTVIIQGGCRGADKMASRLAAKYGLVCSEYIALWDIYGKAAGPMRNEKMITDGFPDLVVAFHNDLEHSKGTKNMLERANKHGIPVKVIRSEMS